MKKQAFVIFLDTDRVRIGRTDGQDIAFFDAAPGSDPTPGSAPAPGNDPAAAAAMIQDLPGVLQQAGHRDEPLTVALPSDWVLCAQIATEGLPRQQRHRAMAYRLEEKLPISTEQFTAAFIEHPDKALGVCVENDRIRPLIDAMEASGLIVASVIPMALLVEPTHAAKEGFWLLRHERGADLIGFEQGKPWLWRSATSECEALLWTAVNQFILERHPQGAPALTPAVIEPPEVIEEAACRAAWEAMHHGTPLVADLRRGALAEADRLRAVRTPLRFALGALAVAMLMVGVAAWWRAEQLADHAKDLRQQQREVFRGALPDYRVPPSPRLVLQSELNKLLATSGETGATPKPGQALQTLHDVLQRLPSNLRFRVLELRIDGDKVYLDGESRSHGDADLIAASLRRRGGFEVEPVRTERLKDQGVAFTLNAEHRALTPALARQEEAP